MLQIRPLPWIAILAIALMFSSKGEHARVDIKSESDGIILQVVGPRDEPLSDEVQALLFLPDAACPNIRLIILPTVATTQGALVCANATLHFNDTEDKNPVTLQVSYRSLPKQVTYNVSDFPKDFPTAVLDLKEKKAREFFSYAAGTREVTALLKLKLEDSVHK